MDVAKRIGSQDVSLRQLFPAARMISTPDMTVRRCSADASDCSPGDVFVAGIDDTPADEAAAEAVAGGAIGIITEQLLPVSVPQCIVADAREAYAHLVSELAGKPSQQMLSIGVAGIDGKTSTTLMVAAALRKSGLRVAYNCDLGRSDGIIQDVPRRPLSDAQDLTDWYADASDSGCQVAVVELSEAMLRSHAADGTSFDIMILSGDSDHAYLKSAQGGSLFDEAISHVRSKGLVILNESNAVAAQAAESSDLSILTYGTSQEADVVGRIMERHAGETTFLITAGDTTAAVRSRMTGDWMFHHQLAAAATALVMDFPLETVAAGLSAMEKIPGRMQRVASYTGPQIVLDDADCPERVMATINTLRKELPRRGKIWCIAACDHRRTATHAANLGYITERCSDHLVLTSGVSGTDEFLSLVHEMLDGVVAPAKPQLIANREAAIQWTINKATPNDLVVILGGWCPDSPRTIRAAIDADTKLAEQALERVEAIDDSEPVILPHPALLASM
ncbi:glutamate ligase domain-containing protein [Rosistilla oblonga]|uniref:glutamate ligase domain-containing protein n=1 Tax=Rosistilla oblonga TaxID=2527990 RepID=UPI003A9746ED